MRPTECRTQSAARKPPPHSNRPITSFRRHSLLSTLYSLPAEESIPATVSLRVAISNPFEKRPAEFQRNFYSKHTRRRSLAAESPRRCCICCGCCCCCFAFAFAFAALKTPLTLTSLVLCSFGFSASELAIERACHRTSWPSARESAPMERVLESFLCVHFANKFIPHQRQSLSLQNSGQNSRLIAFFPSLRLDNLATEEGRSKV